MAFVDDLKIGIDRAVRIAKMERPAIAAVAADPNALLVGIAIVAIGGVLGGIGGLRQGVVATLFGIFIGPIAAVAMSFVVVGLWYLIGMLFKPPRWDFMELYRPVSHLLILSWIGIVNIVPFLGGLIMMVVGIYEIVVAVVVVETVGQLENQRGKAIAIVLIPMAICCALLLPFLFLFGGLALLGLSQAAR